MSSRCEMQNHLSSLYSEFLDEISNYTEQLDDITKFVATVDLVTSKAYVAKLYNYSKPTIKESDSSCIAIKGVRHILIEQLLSDEIYITNDIELNDSQLGMLL